MSKESKENSQGRTTNVKDLKIGVPTLIHLLFTFASLLSLYFIMRFDIDIIKDRSLRNEKYISELNSGQKKIIEKLYEFKVEIIKEINKQKEK